MSRCSSFGNCTSLRHLDRGDRSGLACRSQFLRELHFIEAFFVPGEPITEGCRSSFGNCTSLRLQELVQGLPRRAVAVPSGTALH